MRKLLFISIAATVVMFILREQVGELAYDAGRVIGLGHEMAVSIRGFFVNRWALALCALAATYFAYRLSSLSRNSN